MIKEKKSMTSFDVAAIVRRIEPYSGSKLVNIYDYMDGVLLRFKGAREGLIAAIPSERFHPTKYEPSEKAMPSPFVMGLRKYLRDARLTSVYQHGFDRVVVLEFEKGGERRRLVVELLPRGVIALLDDKGTIVYASEEKQMRDRVIRRGVRYEFPPSTTVHPSKLDAGSVREILSKGSGEALRILSRTLGYPGEVLEEVFARLDIDVGAESGDVLGRAEDIVLEVRRVYDECMEGRGYVLLDGDRLVTVVCFRPVGLAGRYGFRVREFSAFEEALDYYFSRKASSSSASRELDELEAERAKLRASLQAAVENLKRLEERAKRLEEQAAFMAEHMAEIYEAYECALRVRERSGWEAIPGNCPGVVDVEPSRGVIRLSIAGRLLELDVRIPPDRQVVDIYRRIGEIRAKIERGKRAVAEAEKKLQEVEERIRARRARAAAQLRRREWYEKYHWIVTSSGLLAIGGRDASQNESIVKKYLNERRIFMHADIHGAPAVILFAEGRQPSEQDILEAALLAAAYSKAWKAGMGSVEVYWVWGSQVSKSPPSGEYLAKGAFMVYGRKNYVGPIELKLAIGVGLEEGKPVVIVGPDYLVRRRSVVYAVLVPGDEDPSQLAKRLRRLFIEKVSGEIKPIIEAVGVEEIRSRIPGRARIIYVGRGEAREPPRPLRVLHDEKA